MEYIDSFLDELTRLSKRYKIEIQGCGCCGSPSLRNLLDASIEEDVDIYGYDGLDGHYIVNKNNKDLTWIKNDES